MAFRPAIVRASLLCVLVAILPALDAEACPWCKKSPNGWGFCRYYFTAGADWCEEYVADEFSGRTWCRLEGYCNWNDPTLLKDDGAEEPTFACGVLEMDPLQVGIY